VALPLDSPREYRGPVRLRGEARLALAVLEDAFGCLAGSHEPWHFPPRLFRWEAEQWIDSRDRAPLFSFERICSILHLDADSIREELRGQRAPRVAMMDRKEASSG
jgi:hypothetical protein